MNSCIEVDCLVVGGGVIGLAVAARMAEKYSVLLAEKNPHFGQETSSRNTEVIHSGIYYPPQSAKARLCIEGREALYSTCERFGISHRKVGKYVLAVSEEEREALHGIADNAKALSVPFLFVRPNELFCEEPLVQAVEALFFPESGIVDSHGLMRFLEARALQRGALLALRHEVKSVERGSGAFLTALTSPAADVGVKSTWVVNSAGLGAAAVHQRVTGSRRFEHRFCRGRYFQLASRYKGKLTHLIYPVPPKDGLGVHVTVDLGENLRLGPDVDWNPGVAYEDVDSLYDCDWQALGPAFLLAARRYLPALAPTDISPGLIGVRPKLFVDGVAHPDFLVDNEDGFLSLLGIESPGLTASLALANEVARKLEES